MSRLCRFFYSALIVVIFVLQGSLPLSANGDNLVSGGDLVQQINLSNQVDNHRCLINLEQHRYSAAVSNCISLLKEHPDNVNAQLNLGLAYYYLAQYPEAIAQYNLVIAQNERDYRAYYNRGLVYAARREYQPAIADYDHSLAVFERSDPKSQAIIYNDLGVAYTMLGNYQQAIANLDLAIEIQPDQFGAYFNRGCANHRIGNYQQGIKDFSRVISLQPNYTEAYISRSILHHLLQHERLAYLDLDLALQQYQAQGEKDLLPQVLELRQTMIDAQVNRLG